MFQKPYRVTHLSLALALGALLVLLAAMPAQISAQALASPVFGKDGDPGGGHRVSAHDYESVDKESDGDSSIAGRDILSLLRDEEVLSEYRSHAGVTGDPAQSVNASTPVFVSARTDTAGGKVILTFSEDVFVSPLVRYVGELYDVPLSDFILISMTVTIDGHEDVLDSASISGATLSLVVNAPPISTGQQVQVAYNNIFAVNAGGLLIDSAGNAVSLFSTRTVENRSVVSAGAALAPGPVLSTRSLTISEGSSSTYTVTLPSQPSEDVKVNVDASPGPVAFAQPSSLTFTPENWDEPQTVTVQTGVDNNSIDAWVIAGTSYVGGGIGRPSTFVRIVVDDQDTPLALSGSTSASYDEGETSDVATYSVTNSGSNSISWRLFGPDKGSFTIDGQGVLRFQSPPDYEYPKDADGDNVYLLTIEASDGSSTGFLPVVQITVTDVDDAPSTDATLSNMTLSDVDIGTFDSATTSYSASVANSVSETTVTPTVNDSGATYVIKLGGVVDSDGTVSLAAGSNTITVEVTAADGQTTKTYTITVTRADPPSTDATLSALSLSDVDIGTFASDTTSYTASVANSVSQTTVTPTVNDDGATYVVKLGGVSDADGTVSLSVGSNVITVEVTAEDGQTTRTYTVTVTRAAPPSTDATLSALTLSDVDIGTFASGTASYTAQVAHNVSETTVTPTVSDDGATYVVKLGGVTDADGTVSLSVGSNVITVEVTAEDGQTTRTYTVTVTRADPPSADATLKALTLSDVNIRTFNSTTTSYSASVANSVSETTVTPTVNDSGATYVIKLGGVVDSDGTVSLAVGSNTITVEVTAADEQTTKTYTITVTRAAPPSTDATLSALSLSDVDIGTFASDTTSYTASVANSVSQTTVTPTVNDDGATYVVKLDGSSDADGTVSLSVGSNVITVEVTAEDGQTTRTYTVTVTRAAPPSTDATLSALTLSGINIGTFASGTTAYTARVAHSVSRTTVTPTVNHSSATFVIKIGGAADPDGTVSLSVGSNVITVEVTAEDGQTTQAYTITVTRAGPPNPIRESSDASLSGLTLSGINFGTFDSAITSYSASVASTISQTTVTPTPNNDGASYIIRIGGVTDADRTVPLSVGSNVITVEVTAEDEQTTRTYTVTVTRAAPPSTDATLSALTLSAVDIGTFDSTTTSYSASVANSVSETTVTPIVNDSGATYVIRLGDVTDTDGTVSLSVGSNAITVEVTAEDGETTRTYTVTVTRADPPSTDATLSALTLSGIDIGTFASGTTAYTAQVPNSVSRTTVTPTVNDDGATYVIRLDGAADSDGTVSLSVGSNVITVEVTAEDGQTTRTYTVTVTRAAPSNPIRKSDDASLSGLTLSGINFGTFDSTTTSYSAQVANSVSQTTVTPILSDSNASYVIRLGGVADADGTVSLSVSSNVITIDVTAEDGVTTQKYTVIVTRSAPPSADATLSALTLSGVNFGTFASGTISYTADVANSVSQTTVTPTASHSGASYIIRLGGVTDADGTVALNVGSNVITIQVTAQDGQTTRTYTVTVSRAAPLSTDATLSALVLAGIHIGTFDSSTLSYRAQVGYGVSQTTVTPTTSNPNATYVIKSGGVADSDGEVALVVGENIITIEVTAQDGETTRTYTVAISRAAEDSQPVPELSTDATLSGIELSGTELEDFDAATTSYSVLVVNDVTETTVTATTSHTGASYVVRLDGTETPDGVVQLSVGDNVVTIEVTAEDGETTATYTVTITREVPAPYLIGDLPSDDPPVNIRVTSYSDESVTLQWEVPRNRGITNYTLSRDLHDGTEFVSSTDWSAEGRAAGGDSITWTDVTDVQANTLYRYGISLKNDAETNIIEKFVEVRTLATAEPPDLSTDATLSELALSGFDFDTDFAPSEYRYIAAVANDTTQATITATPADTDATYVVRLGGTDVDGDTLDLVTGRNVITVEVIAEDGETTSFYTVVVSRAKPAGTLSSDASLRSLSLRDIHYGVFDSDTTEYTAEVAHEVSETTVTPVRYDVEASHVIKLNGALIESANAALAVGENVIAVEVTAEDGETTETYTVTVTRAADPCGGSIDADTTIESIWDDACLTEKDAPGGEGDRYARFYTFTLDEAADIVISLSSEEDTYLYLLDGHGRDGDMLHENDDIVYGADLNSRLSITLQPGDYTIEATTYRAETEGNFTLTIAGLGEAEEPAPEPQPEPEADACVESVHSDGMLDGTWDVMCLSNRAAPSGEGDRYARFYTFTIEQSSDVTITLKSDEDTYLYLLDGHGRDGAVLYEEDDIEYGVNTDSMLSETLQAGDYTIEATTYYAGKQGNFELTIEVDSP